MSDAVCLIVEGTYPYVAGGVSAWTHRLLRDLPDIDFHVHHLGSLPKPSRKPSYDLPPNVRGLSEVFIHAVSLDGIGRDPYPASTWKAIEDFHRLLKQGDVSGFGDLLRRLAPGGRWPRPEDLLNSRQAWDLLTRSFNELAPDQSFVDYFWTWRFIHLPLLKVLASPPPPAAIYHAISTGYAGLAAAAAGVTTDRPALLTEHGIYTLERRMEVDRAEWVHAPGEDGLSVTPDAGYFKGMWVRFFDSLARLAYVHAEKIVSLSQRARETQVSLGADPSRTLVIPNGVEVEDFIALADEERGAPVVAFVGRVVAVKDVKRFIKACRVVADAVPEARFVIFGPMDEEPAYATVCRELIHVLELEGKVLLKGEQPLEVILPSMDVMVLTSHFESQPLAIMEAMAGRVPVVAPDVGACAELLLGGSRPGDRQTGPAGIITRPGDMEETAQAVVRLCHSAKERRRLGANGRKRIQNFYRLDTLIDRYRELYGSLRGERNHGGDRV